MELKVTQEPLENCQVRLTVEVEQKRVDQELQKAARKLSSQYQFPGFRKGKAPYSRVVQAVGIQSLYGEFIDELGQEVYKQVLENEEIEPYATASLTDVKYDPLRYILDVPVEPIIGLGDYRSLRVAEEVEEVTDEMVEERMVRYQKQYADWKAVTRPSQYGDTMKIDVRSILTEPDEGEDETVVLDENDWEVTPDQENPTDPPGFDEALVGMSVGENKAFTLSWPEDSQSIYAGKSANFTVTVHSVEAHENAELNDELAQLIGPEFETVADLHKGTRETLEEEAKSKADALYLGRSFEAILAQSTLKYPPIVIEDQLDAMINDFAGQLRQYGIQDMDAYLENVGQTRQQLRDSQREQAVQIAERNLVLSELIRLEGLMAEEADIERQVKLMLGEDPDAEVADAETVEADSNDVAAEGEVSEGEVAETSDSESGETEDSAVDAKDDEQAEMERYRTSMFEMFRDGPGRGMIESQILTQKAQERLLAIVRGEELPEPTPLPAKGDEAATEVSDVETPAAEAEVVSES